MSVNLKIKYGMNCSPFFMWYTKFCAKLLFMRFDQNLFLFIWMHMFLFIYIYSNLFKVVSIRYNKITHVIFLPFKTFLDIWYMLEFGYRFCFMTWSAPKMLTCGKSFLHSKGKHLPNTSLWYYDFFLKLLKRSWLACWCIIKVQFY